ncbi:MAG: DUF3581 family protein [Proteobacteria bacterium]|nr:DUF3581 family protein [Pseudomonadota bacterium]MCH8176607.1 DUF3581 family protein [Pseudomonadota bacterium]
MNIEKYYHLEDSKLSFTRLQASNFAKTLAGDFNPIHDPDSKRFCVPGDLLFAAIIKHYGLRQVMGISFSGMVGDDVTLYLPEVTAREISIYDEKDKKYLDISTNGELSRDEKLIDSLLRSYVEFSGHSFPDLLIPLLKQNNVMINTERPLVIYDHMRIALDTLDVDEMTLKFTNSEFRIYGKRADVAFNFNFTSNGEIIGKGQKKMVLSGLREYDQEKIDLLLIWYNERKNKHGNQAAL